MQICDGTGNLSSDFLERLEKLKEEQKDNLRELERLKIDAFIEGRNVQDKNIRDQSQIKNFGFGRIEPDTIEKTISEMWSDFNLSERLSKMQLPENIHKKSDIKGATKDSWTPSITIPEPFSMTVREENNPRGPKHSRASLEVEAARLKREMLEAKITSNQFKSRPIPAETFYPLYHDIVLQSESRRKVVLENRKLEFENYMNPPSFIQREEKKKFEKSRKIRELKDQEEKMIQLLSNSFRATDLDETIFEEPNNFEEERKLRIEERSRTLLRSASLPRRMKSAPVRRAASATGEIEKFSRKFHHVPDFKKLHQINQTKMEQKKRDDEELRNKRPKTAAPVLQTAQRATEKPPVNYDEPEVTFRASKIGFLPTESPPIKANDTFALRKDFVSRTLDLLETELKTEQEKIKERKIKERNTAKLLRKKLPPKANQTSQVEKLRELQSEDRRRLKEYRRMLNEIHNKVDERPLLFTQS